MAENHYPSEAVRAELATRLNLSEKQLRMWFNHRRLKDRKGKEEESLNVNVTINADTSVARKKPKHTISEYPGAVPISNPSATVIQYAEEGGFSGKRRNQAVASEMAKAEAAAIAAVEAQLGEPLREDGPPLGFEFDPLPPGAFSTNGNGHGALSLFVQCLHTGVHGKIVFVSCLNLQVVYFCSGSNACGAQACHGARTLSIREDV